MHRGILLLTWLMLVALAPAAMGDDVSGPPARSAARLRPPAPPMNRGAMDPMPGAHRDVLVAPAGYVAQQPIPGEPLGFSQSRFNPSSAPLVDPGAGAGMEYEYLQEEMYFDSDDPDAPAPATSSGEWLDNGHWYVDARANYMQRLATLKNRTPLSFEFLGTANLSENRLAVQQDLGYQPGLDITFGRFLGRDIRNRDHAVEFTFMGLNHWQFDKSITARTPGTIFLAFDALARVPVYDGSDTQAVDQTSDFNSYEFNYRIDRRLGRDRMVYSRDSQWVREATSNWTYAFITGIRTVIVNERLQWTASNSLGNGRYDVVTHNNMVGPQIAGEAYYDHAYWRLGVRAKTGALVNFATQSSTVRILDNAGDPLSPNRNEYAKSHSMGFVGGFTFMGEYRFRPNFALKTSFDLFWVTDLALAQNQLTFFPSNPAQISDNHTLLFDAFTIGFEWYR